jgi:hypothetical protein
MNGCLDVLNVGHGHLAFKFDRSDPDQEAKAKKVITDMLKRGYMLFVLSGGEQKRVRKFDPVHDEYILEEPEVIAEPPAEPVADRVGSSARRVGKHQAKRLPMRESKATAIAPTAGG